MYLFTFLIIILSRMKVLSLLVEEIISLYITYSCCTENIFQKAVNYYGRLACINNMICSNCVFLSEVRIVYRLKGSIS